MAARDAASGPFRRQDGCRGEACRPSACGALQARRASRSGCGGNLFRSRPRRHPLRSPGKRRGPAAGGKVRPARPVSPSDREGGQTYDCAPSRTGGATDESRKSFATAEKVFAKGAGRDASSVLLDEDVSRLARPLQFLLSSSKELRSQKPCLEFFACARDASSFVCLRKRGRAPSSISTHEFEGIAEPKAMSGVFCMRARRIFICLPSQTGSRVLFNFYSRVQLNCGGLSPCAA